VTEQTGKQVLEQVREALAREWVEHEDPALAALDGCVVLTAEEAEKVRSALLALYGYQGPTGPAIQRRATNEALALLTPTERSPHKLGESGLFDPMPGDGYADDERRV
jgi:hypothetical protein